MSNILVIDSSASAEGAVSRLLVDETVERLLAADPMARVVRRDLGAEPVPHLTTATLAGVRGEPATEAEHAARALSNTLIAELRAANTVVIGAPMYNFGMPTGLRAWFDHVLRAGETFRYTESGPQGLLGGKRVIVIEPRGGSYSEGSTQSFDFQEPYLHHLFAFVGITDVTYIRVEKIGYGPDARASSVAAARAQIATILPRDLGRAA